MKPTVWRLGDAVKDLKDIEGKGRGERDGKERGKGERGYSHGILDLLRDLLLGQREINNWD
jgi:hypothetical protein